MIECPVCLKTAYTHASIAAHVEICLQRREKIEKERSKDSSIAERKDQWNERKADTRTVVVETRNDNEKMRVTNSASHKQSIPQLDDANGKKMNGQESIKEKIRRLARLPSNTTVERLCSKPDRGMKSRWMRDRIIYFNDQQLAELETVSHLNLLRSGGLWLDSCCLDTKTKKQKKSNNGNDSDYNNCNNGKAMLFHEMTSSTEQSEVVDDKTIPASSTSRNSFNEMRYFHRPLSSSLSHGENCTTVREVGVEWILELESAMSSRAQKQQSQDWFDAAKSGSSVLGTDFWATLAMKMEQFRRSSPSSDTSEEKSSKTLQRVTEESEVALPAEAVYGARAESPVATVSISPLNIPNKTVTNVLPLRSTAREASTETMDLTEKVDYSSLDQSTALPTRSCNQSSAGGEPRCEQNLNRFGKVRVVRPEGASVRSDVDIDASVVLFKLLLGCEVFYDAIVPLPPPNPTEQEHRRLAGKEFIVVVDRVRLYTPVDIVSSQLSNPSERAALLCRHREVVDGVECLVGWASLTARTNLDHAPILEIVRPVKPQPIPETLTTTPSNLAENCSVLTISQGRLSAKAAPAASDRSENGVKVASSTLASSFQSRGERQPSSVFPVAAESEDSWNDVLCESSSAYRGMLHATSRPNPTDKSMRYRSRRSSQREDSRDPQIPQKKQRQQNQQQQLTTHLVLPTSSSSTSSPFSSNKTPPNSPTVTSSPSEPPTRCPICDAILFSLTSPQRSQHINLCTEELETIEQQIF